MTTGHTKHGKRVYRCGARACVSRAANDVDELVEGLVIARLSQPDAVELLSKREGPDVARLRAEAASIRERLDDLATGLEEGLLTMAAVRRSSDRLRQKLAEVEAAVDTATSADFLAPLVTAEDPAEVWHRADLQQKRAVIDALMTITLQRPKQGRNIFDPNSVTIEWKS